MQDLRRPSHAYTVEAALKPLRSYVKTVEGCTRAIVGLGASVDSLLIVRTSSCLVLCSYLVVLYAGSKWVPVTHQCSLQLPPHSNPPHPSQSQAAPPHCCSGQVRLRPPRCRGPLPRPPDLPLPSPTECRQLQKPIPWHGRLAGTVCTQGRVEVHTVGTSWAGTHVP